MATPPKSKHKPRADKYPASCKPGKDRVRVSTIDDALLNTGEDEAAPLTGCGGCCGGGRCGEAEGPRVGGALPLLIGSEGA